MAEAEVNSKPTHPSAKLPIPDPEKKVRQLRHDEAMAEARRQLKRYTAGHEGAMRRAQEAMRETTRRHEQALRDAHAKIQQLEHDKAMAEAAAKMQSLRQMEAG